MALQNSDLFIVQRNQQSYKMPASEILGIIPPSATVGNGTITIVQPGTSNQTFTVNQTGNTTITLKNDNTNTTYSAGNGLTLSGTTFNVGAGTGITVAANTVGISNGGVGTTQLADNSVNAAKLNVSGNGSSGQYLRSDGDGSFTWATVSTPAPSVPAGSVMLFQQSSAPSGWTKSTSHNNKALRIVSGNVGSGGSSAFTSVITSRTPSGSFSGSLSGGSVSAHTLTTAQIPSHSHPITGRDGSTHESYPYGVKSDNGASAAGVGTNATGGGESHTHSISGGSVTGDLSMSAMDFAVQYVDVIIATKN